jgi:hypothetical protein
VAKIVDLNENPPPDPLATDTNPGYTVPSVHETARKRRLTGRMELLLGAELVWHSD